MARPAAPSTREAEREREVIRELLRALKRGDPGAFDYLVKLIGARVHTVFRVWLQQLREEDAEDLLQEFYRRVYELRDRIDPDRFSMSYFYRVAKSMKVDYLRRVQRRPVTLSIADPNLTIENNYTTPSHEAELAAREALSTLTVEELALARLRFRFGLSEEEAAERLGMPVTTAQYHMRQVRRKLLAVTTEPPSKSPKASRKAARQAVELEGTGR